MLTAINFWSLDSYKNQTAIFEIILSNHLIPYQLIHLNPRP